MIKRWFAVSLCVVGAYFMLVSLLLAASTPMTMTFQATVSSQRDGLVDGRRRVEVRIYDGSGTGATSKWSEIYESVLFVKGAFGVVLGANKNNPLTPDVFDKNTNPNLSVSINDPVTGAFTTIYFPIPSAPYALQSRVAETVLKVDASKITGAFTSTVNITNDLNVSNGTLVVKNTAKNVGIGTTLPNPAYKLDVSGIINAQSFLVNGQDLETALSWKKLNNNLYYTAGFVGIGTVTPQFDLDVVGTVNAKQYLINGADLGEKLRAELAWKNGPGKDIYFDDGVLPNGGYVGIGTNDPTEKLDVRGAVRVGASLETNPSAGTMQYKDNDFQGYTSQGWKSLTGLQGNGVSSQLAYWSGTKTLAGSNNLVWDSSKNMLGIGTSAPKARLDIVGVAGSPALDIKNAANQSILYVTDARVGVGTSSPQQALDVAGIVNATDYLVNGQPLNKAFSTDSFWFRENTNRIYYDLGNVGIGTSQPGSLLELASATGNPTITFDIGGVNLFSIGVNTKAKDAFVIAKGGNLDVPVFAFRDNNIGIGINQPSSNLQVSGNSGIIFSGTFGSTTPFTETGRGAKMIWYPAKAAFRAGFVLFDQWDQANLANYSVGFGHSPLVTGEGASVGGGYRNIASGLYATIPGGFSNQASGDYSFAAGHEAKAVHRGSFVWADYTPTSAASAFSSSAGNQFLIRAQNGVGIGTSNTIGSALTIAKAGNSQTFLLRAIGNNGVDAFSVTTSGNVGIGTSRPGNNRLTVMGGGVGIGTTSSFGTLTIKAHSPTQNAFVVMPNANSPTAAILVTASGNVGIGVTTGYKFNPGDRLVITGGIVASEFKVVDPRNPSGTITIQPNPGSPWSDPDRNGGNTSRTQGKVGIGTASPNSLLTLSNKNPSKNAPIITFDIDGTPRYSLGVTQNATKTDYLFTIQPGSTVTSLPSIAIATKSVSIGRGLNSPRVTLDVSGNAIVSGNLSVATTNFNSTYRMIVGGGLNATQLFINGSQFVPLPNPWKTQGANIYYTSGNVGIGISNPSQKLEVRGSVSANGMILSGPISLGSDLVANRLLLRDGASSKFGQFFVSNGEFTYSDPSGNTKVISSPLQRGNGNTGNLAFWVDNSTLGIAPILWDNTATKLTVSGNLAVNRFRKVDDFRVTANANLGGQSALSVAANLSHDGNLATVKGFTAESIAVSIDKNWGNITTPVQVKGLGISMKSASNTVLLNNASAVGLVVDVASVNVNTAEKGQKYAAIFRGGNVGIGMTNPRAELEVAGTVSANYFNLSGGLNVPQLVVNKSAFVAKSVNVIGQNKPRIGIGVTNPENESAELTVKGTVSANAMVIAGGLETVTANIGKGTLFIDASGNIGVGTTKPVGQVDIKRTLTGLMTSDFTSQKIDISVNGAAPGNIFFLNKNLTGLDINLRSLSSVNKLEANATGIKLDLSKLQLTNSSKATGLDINVKGVGGTRYAAVFQGGFVGVGTANPTAELDVVGTINATNLILRGNLQAKRATFNYLVVNKAATFNGVVTINALTVKGTITANTLVLTSTLQAPDAAFATVNANVASVNNTLKTKTLTVLNNIVGQSSSFTKSVGIGTTAPASGLEVSGNIFTKNLFVSDLLTMNTATLNIRNTTTGASYLFIGPNGKVGIGTSQPSSLVHIQSPSLGTFNPADNSTWTTMRLQTRSNDQNVAVGLLLIPDSTTPSKTVGSGIVALRSSSFSGQPGSHLVFITDPAAGAPQERMRITEAGDVGIGTLTPSARLDVNGTMRVSGNMSVDGTVQASQLVSNSGGLLVSPNGLLRIDGVTSINANLQISKSIYLKAITPPASVGGYGSLYVNSTDKNLYYVKPGSNNPINISSPLTGAGKKVPYFNTAGSLSDDTYLYWDAANKRFTVGTSNVMASFEVVTTLNNSSTGAITAEKVYLGFADRSGLSGTPSSTFTGLDVTLAGQTPANPNNFGRLGQGETAIGLRVDVRNLKAKQFSQAGSSLIGYKYAGLFLGGNVGVGISNPSAALHVSAETAGNIPFRVDTLSTANALVVLGNGTVGVGTTSGTARLAIKGEGVGTRTTFHVTDSANKSLLYVRDDGRVGIGTALPSSNLHVVGTVSGNIGTYGTLTATTLNVGNGSLYVNNAGRVGIGTTQPSGNISFYKTFTTSPAADHISQKMQIIVSNSQPNTQVFYSKNITGMDVGISSGAGAFYGQTATPVTVTGVSINMTQMNLHDSSKSTGLYVDVTGATGTRYAGIFLGGNVGIGVKNPTVNLQVSGDIKAKSLILTGAIQGQGATFNTLSVTQVASFNGSVTANRLFVKSVSANAISVTGTLTVATGSFTTINATVRGVFGKLGVGVSLPTRGELDVSGNMYVSRGVTVNGVVHVNKIQALNGGVVTVNAANGMIVNGTVSANNSVQVGGGVYLKKQTSVTGVDAVRGRLYADTNGQLNYVKPGADPSVNFVKLTSFLTGSARRVPYYDDNGNLSGTTNISWDNTAKKLTVGGNGASGQLEILATMNASGLYTNGYAGQSIAMTFGDRTTTGAGNQFTGLDVIMNSSNPSDPFNFGRIADGETAVGVNVDVSALKARYSTEQSGSTPLKGYKYAAVFVGGSVGVGTTAPATALHVINQINGVNPFRVDTLSTANALVVLGNGTVGVGTTTGTSRLTIKGEGTGSRSGLNVTDSTNKPLFYVRDDGKIGVGTPAPSSNIHVVAAAGVSPLRLDTNTQTNALVVGSTGLVGIGTSTPAGSLHITAASSTIAPLKVSFKNGEDNALVVTKNGNVGIRTGNPVYPLSVDGVVLAGTANANSVAKLPTWLVNGASSARGFLANYNVDNVFLGVKQKTGGGAEPVVWWNGDATNTFKWQAFNGTTTVNVMALRGDGRVVISTQNAVVPTASFNIVGQSRKPLFWLSTPTSPNVMVVTGNGFIGMGTRNPSSNLHVQGTLMANTLKVAQGVVRVTSLNVTGVVNVSRLVTTNAVVTGQAIEMLVNADIDAPLAELTGLGIKVSANPNPLFTNPGRRYTLSNGATAVGLKVDMTTMEVRDPVLPAENFPGYKIAALFAGGNVGIGPDVSFKPKYPLHVQSAFITSGGSTFSDVARFGTTDGDLTLRGFSTASSSGQLGFYLRSNETNSMDLGLVMAPGGRVGIGTTNPDSALVVNGDMRIGTIKQGLGSAPHNSLYFSGGPDLSATYDTDNNVPLTMGRYNVSDGVSELRVGIGNTLSASNKFVVGYTSGSYVPVLSVQANGRVGVISDAVAAAAFVPDATFHIKGKVADTSDQLSSHIAVVENSGGDNADGLALYHSGSGASALHANFVTFFSGSTVVGAIQSNPDGGAVSGVKYMTQGADYAEYLQKSDLKETFEKGDIVGLVNGKISKTTRGAQQVMVRSTAASVAGNWPGKDKLHEYELISFFGQVPVKIRGAVRKGDYILPSGFNDGTGIAVAPESILPSQFDSVVGTAWDESSLTGIKLVKTAVGFQFSLPKLGESLTTLQALKKSVDDLKADRQRIEADFNQKLDDQNKQLEALAKELKGK
jgi:hypothetical protein